MNDFLLNDVVVRPRRNELCIDGRSEKLPAKFIDVLMVLAERQGEVFGKAELLKRVWNDPHLGEESVANAVWMLRKTLGDDARRPAYIETVPRRGYRLVARVAPAPIEAPALPATAAIPDAEVVPIAPASPPEPTRPLALTAAPPAAVTAQHARVDRWWPIGLLAALLLIAAVVRLWPADSGVGRDVSPLPFR
ncbi:MAG: winged helix-turn-helix domain-containing protein, partial [Xanthomonadales bacterium]|nr:winged helix-turn-helix domain-containing protein [Xanthomonadales bacterium]